MKNLYLSIVCLSFCLTACGGGGGGSAQNMPIGGTPFTGIFSPGIGNVGIECNFESVPQVTETLTFVVNESEPTFFQDGLLYPNENIFNGFFTNPVNQNNPCFDGNITYSDCGSAQSGTIKFFGCSVYLSASSQYIFHSQYYLYDGFGQLLTTGTVDATK